MLTELIRDFDRRRAVQEAAIVNGLPVQKAKGLPPGTIRTWKGERWRKVEQGKWEKVKEGKSGAEGAFSGILSQKPSTKKERTVSLGYAGEGKYYVAHPKGEGFVVRLGKEESPNVSSLEEAREAMHEHDRTGKWGVEKPQGYAAVRAEREPQEEEARKKFRSLPAKEREAMGEKTRGEGPEQVKHILPRVMAQIAERVQGLSKLSEEGRKYEKEYRGKLTQLSADYKSGKLSYEDFETQHQKLGKEYRAKEDDRQKRYWTAFNAGEKRPSK